ncbi:MAG: phage head closure protein [Xanthomonadales bacterium]|nr:phage head closure protein [Xanthomonadales bacterium]
MTFTAQQLAHQIDLQKQVTIVNEYGEQETVWQTYASPFARVDPLVGREYFAAQQTQSENSVKFTLRWRDDVKPSDRILYRGAEYDITSVMDVGGRHRETLIMAKGTNT